MNLVSRWPGVQLALLVATMLTVLDASQSTAPVPHDPDDIAGTVEGPRGPEAGVWVLAETDSLPTKFRKIVVTDANGQFVVPDLPRATYRVWVRGYGLQDSSPVEAEPGASLRLAAEAAPTPQIAAQAYPPSYWHALLEPPAPEEFPGTGIDGNGIPRFFRTQAEWINAHKIACNNCHVMGEPVTRSTQHLQGFSRSVAAWDHRVRVGQRGPRMSGLLDVFGRARSLEAYADWTDRIAAGEVPPTPPRPVGTERNLVLTMWEWGEETSYIHDLISTDKREPTLNASGPVYGLDFGRDYLTILDPVEGTTSEIKIPVRRNANNRSYYPLSVPVASVLSGEDPIWVAPANPHNPMMDGKGRVWMTTQIRDTDDQPAFCQEGSSHPSARRFPLTRSTRQAGFFDPQTGAFTLIDTCFTTHHLQFDADADSTLYMSDNAGNGTIGWIKTSTFDTTGDEAAAQGWCPIVVDTSGDGKLGDWVDEPAAEGETRLVSYWNQISRSVPPGKDLRLPSGGYGLAVNPVDHTVWGALHSPYPGRLVRLDPRSCLAEVYEPPMNSAPGLGAQGATPRGVDVDRNGVVWTALAGTGHTASFDRRKCKVLNGPTATGQHCPEGWTLYRSPGPQFKGVNDGGSADYHYYIWVDQFNAFGLGPNVPITNGTASDALLAVLPESGEVLTFRVPYPVGFFTRGLDGRIDDPTTGWKGRGLWANNATNTLWHVEGGEGSRSTVVHFQLRPDPLAH